MILGSFIAGLKLVKEVRPLEYLLIYVNICIISLYLPFDALGLPLALITIGRAMAHKKTVEAWNYAIQLLKKSITEFPGMEKVYPRLKFGCDSLPDTRIRSCFLYCVLFPEDYRISKSSLIDCWLGDGLLGGSDGSAGRYQGYSIIGILIRACLLEE